MRSFLSLPHSAAASAAPSQGAVVGPRSSAKGGEEQEITMVTMDDMGSMASE
eukprot:CAMPEP_0195150082 /NCGR_PEP_ID=MMETSP0448-20130528/178207_1 /TAXON_ID=66468 /ORGANISM="Heterocapsa triquestra, Strain CCMP 448" /LENGTH=51 /DNA_ID=CAMNT_0040188749 /DNA_START=37 /DNA_END=189 /DNA_ORIENTATION=-